MSIDYKLRAHVATITINRPETRNSLDMEHFRDLAHAWAAFRDDDRAWVAVITGVGRDFCTGADLKKFIPELTGDHGDPGAGVIAKGHPRVGQIAEMFHVQRVARLGTVDRDSRNVGVQCVIDAHNVRR